jgi:hypothetical protein
MFIVMYFDEATYCVGPFDTEAEARDAAREMPQPAAVHEVEPFVPAAADAGTEWVAA